MKRWNSFFLPRSFSVAFRFLDDFYNCPDWATHPHIFGRIHGLQGAAGWAAGKDFFTYGLWKAVRISRVNQTYLTNQSINQSINQLINQLVVCVGQRRFSSFFTFSKLYLVLLRVSRWIYCGSFVRKRCFSSSFSTYPGTCAVRTLTYWRTPSIVTSRSTRPAWRLASEQTSGTYHWEISFTRDLHRCPVKFSDDR